MFSYHERCKINGTDQSYLSVCCIRVYILFVIYATKEHDDDDDDAYKNKIIYRMMKRPTKMLFLFFFCFLKEQPVHGITQIYRFLCISYNFSFLLCHYKNLFRKSSCVWDDAWCGDDIILNMLFLMLFYILL